ncbi:FG-GAP repeat domain-containing protein [Actinocorallia herbida]|uniref:FG-GAP repeat domain-containing protein n=1 Tax=Actinocorallia herbida TaxID=58109 RepID=UPI001B86D976|nr:VCBS repeat-containing protein [Actinocorallia herbida]
MRSIRRLALPLAVGLACGAALPAAAGGSRPALKPTDPPKPAAFTRHVVDGALQGAAFSVASDVSGDRRPEIVATGFGTIVPGGPAPSGEVAVYKMGRDIDTWAKERVFGPEAGIAYPNEPAAADFDRDGDADIAVPGGFFQCAPAKCGSLTWWEQTRKGWERHDLVAPGTQPLFYHGAVPVDFDRDGRLDLVTIGESFPAPVALLPGRAPSNAWVQVFRGKRGGGFATEPVTLGAGGGALPEVADIDRDGDLDVASAQYFQSGASYVWLENLGGGRYTTHTIDTTQGRSIQIKLVRNLRGDRRDVWVASNHTNTAFPPGSSDPVSQVVTYAVPKDPRQAWTPTSISEGITARPRPGQAAPGVIGDGDIDGDGDLDIAVSGDGDPRLFWLEQRGDGSFATHVLAEGHGQAGGAIVADLDRDRRNDLAFSVYELNSVVVFTRSGGGKVPAKP